MSTTSKNNGKCSNCCVDVQGGVCGSADFGGEIAPNSEPVYNFDFIVFYDDESKIQKECKGAADDAIIASYKDELIEALKNQAKQWVNDCLNAQPAPCNQAAYTNPETGVIEPNPAYKPYPSTLLECEEFDVSLCFNNCDGECTVE
jgi:hypothetical protein